MADYSAEIFITFQLHLKQNKEVAAGAGLGMYKHGLVVRIDWYNMFSAFDWQTFVCNVFLRV